MTDGFEFAPTEQTKLVIFSHFIKRRIWVLQRNER